MLFRVHIFILQIYLYLVIVSPSYAQDNYMLGEDNNIEALCKPGVFKKSPSKGIVLEYSLLNSPSTNIPLNANDAPTDYLDHFKAKIKVPLWVSPKLNIFAGYEHSRVNYQTNNLILNETLKNNSISLYLAKPINDKNYTIFRFRSRFSGDYESFFQLDKDHLTYSAMAIWGIKPSNYKEWGIGLLYGKNYTSEYVLPFLVYNHTFNEKWGIETVLPVKIYARYNFSKDFLLLGGFEYNSATYRLAHRQEINFEVQSYLRHSAALLQLKIEKKLVPWIWVNTNIGVQIPIENSLRNDNNDTLIINDINGNTILKFGIFVSPPS